MEQLLAYRYYGRALGRQDLIFEPVRGRTMSMSLQSAAQVGSAPDGAGRAPILEADRRDTARKSAEKQARA